MTHIPVMLNEVIDALAPRDGGIYVDGTFGCGGYSKAILEAADCKVFGIDRDPDAVEIAHEFEKKYDGRFSIIHGCFGDMAELMQENGVESVDGVVLDIGVSSPQINTPERGFSFRLDGLLDMRMAQDGTSAADVVNNMDETDLANIIYRYGEERKSRFAARAIVTARKQNPITTTGELANIVRSAVRKSKDGIDPATRTFQALRIYVNDELGELERGLSGAEKILNPDGNLAVVSFHSLEDRIVKNFMKERSGANSQPSRHAPMIEKTFNPTFKAVTKRPLTASDEEVRGNPRSRSAKLRVATRTNVTLKNNYQDRTSVKAG
ncbi:MAG: 16S rRNA (cytosine(1402)-N(4))-methyltransferase RsmH [Alphaproteobacteria bacterium]|nr:16S rRNA (cytosine(1402)-N(4))-methyltransferase RsmH [Alphaproteobacteria bacterium]